MKRLCTNVDLMLGQRLRRWPNIRSTIGALNCIGFGLCVQLSVKMTSAFYEIRINHSLFIINPSDLNRMKKTQLLTQLEGVS